MTFYFFDLETSGFSARTDRIMQFAGQRTDMDLKPAGEPDNILIKITPDVLPQPDAVLVHGITPQQTLADGITEAEFCKYLTSQVCSPDTIMVGYNNVRFDNDFIRFTLWRNFHDAYEWSWKNGCSTWDLLDVVRMTRALRPEGIKWPFAPDGKPSNRLEYLTAVNKLEHENAHDALSDVNAAIDVARLIKSKQPKLFDYLLSHRTKSKVAPLIGAGQPVVYTSGRYPSDFEKTAIAALAAEKPDKSGALMYDLRIDPAEFKDLPPAELARLWKARGEDAPYFPVKELKYNKCPAVAPMGVVDEASYSRLALHKEIIASHHKKLQAAEGFGKRLLEARDMMWPASQTGLVSDAQTVDEQLYDGFIPDADKDKMSVVRAAKPDELSDLALDFKDDRLRLMLPLYKARNFPKFLEDDELAGWEAFRKARLTGGKKSRAGEFFEKLEELAKTPGLDSNKQYLIEELNLYAQSVIPAD
ncbi:MAG TPA: exodeoxyribonuclease I [Candidatus Saccharimonadales bacterium]|nr:exodeoxyribonuclease I [Candidatus Saccharimonadales bacterium]